MPQRTFSSGDNAWRFHREPAERVARFFELLPHVKGRLAGRPFRLLPWQRKRIIDPIFGRLRVSDGLRVVRIAYIELGAKNGKSPIGSGVALQGLFADREPGAEVFSVAGSKGQAGIIFNVAADMVERSPTLSPRAKVYRSKIAHHGVIEVIKGPARGSIYRVLSADVGLNDGINGSRVVFDEIHRQPSRELWDLMQKSGAARQQPLLIGFTTAGEQDPASLAWQEHEYGLKVAAGTIEDPTYYAFIRYNPTKLTAKDGTETEPDWRSEEVWRNANPGLGTREEVAEGDAILAIEDFRATIPKLEESPAELLTFKRLRLGMWLPKGAGSTDKLIDIAMWDRSAGMSNVDKLAARHAPGWAAVDMSSTEDMTAAGLLIENEPGECRERHCLKRSPAEPCYTYQLKAWLPEDTIAGGRTWSKAMRTQLRLWHDAGLLEAVDGAVIDDRDVEAGILEWADRFTVTEIAIDRWQARQLRIRLEEEGFTVWELSQGMPSMAEPTRHTLALLRARRIHHLGNPMLRWMADNAIGKSDPDGNVRPVRGRSSGRIDGIITLIGTVAAMLRTDEGGLIDETAVS